MNKKLATYAAIFLLSSLPVTTFAVSNATTHYIQCDGAGTSLCSLIDQVIQYFNWALILLMGFAVLMFTWYVIKYYILPNEDRKEAGQYVMYSILGFFVILSLWGLVNILSNTFGGLGNAANKNNTINNLPLFPTQ